MKAFIVAEGGVKGIPLPDSRVGVPSIHTHGISVQDIVFYQSPLGLTDQDTVSAHVGDIVVHHFHIAGSLVVISYPIIPGCVICTVVIHIAVSVIRIVKVLQVRNAHQLDSCPVYLVDPVVLERHSVEIGELTIITVGDNLHTDTAVHLIDLALFISVHIMYVAVVNDDPSVSAAILITCLGLVGILRAGVDGHMDAQAAGILKIHLFPTAW